MPKKNTSPQDTQNQDSRLDELEIKLSFLEKELEEYKEANRIMYAKLSRVEEGLKKMEKEIPGSSRPVPEPSWDSENRDIHP